MVSSAVKNIALIVAAGRGMRLPGKIPKQYRVLYGHTVLKWSVLSFLLHSKIDTVQVVYNPEDSDLYELSLGDLDLAPPIKGGKNRQISVRLGLESISELRPRNILIHDGARPIVPKSLIDRVLFSLEKNITAIPVIPINDTIIRINEKKIIQNIDRTDLWQVQTPQGFHFDAILEAHQNKQDNIYTDDSSIADSVGIPINLIPGAKENIKITTKNDFNYLAENVLLTETRVGSGYDVHRLGPGKEVRLAGVSIPNEKGLIGHSDADVVLHALTDGILGVLGAGDIGEHFPNNNPKYKDLDSKHFLLEAYKLLHTVGGNVLHIDITIICETPKISPYRHKMKSNIARLLKLELDRVSIKATTTEGLGFTGRKEGISAHATVTISMPKHKSY
jgi:2-C-methyl-D-erythritol 4-phosphate cytidylyltransferase/2-C-methyl-D-erythritol 2,4-cyclodiphosphate synthase